LEKLEEGTMSGILHNKVRIATGDLAHTQNGQNMWMVHSGDSADFPSKKVGGVTIGDMLGCHHLQSHTALQGRKLLGLIDIAKGARADPADYATIAQQGTIQKISTITTEHLLSSFICFCMFNYITR
jgi:hypothetical protein